jgi:3-oxoacyl-[acyl-carrier-protein] synthase II
VTRRRVVVTGLGCISPVGNTVAEAWANLLAGRSGIDTITSFDASSYACKFAGEVKGFNIADYITEKESRHMDRFISAWQLHSRRSRMPVCPRAMP